MNKNIKTGIIAGIIVIVGLIVFAVIKKPKAKTKGEPTITEEELEEINSENSDMQKITILEQLVEDEEIE